MLEGNYEITISFFLFPIKLIIEAVYLLRHLIARFRDRRMHIWSLWTYGKTYDRVSGMPWGWF